MPVSGLFFFFPRDARYGPQPRRFGTGTYLFLFVERIVEFLTCTSPLPPEFHNCGIVVPEVDSTYVETTVPYNTLEQY
jgi:hypothetical protein